MCFVTLEERIKPQSTPIAMSSFSLFALPKFHVGWKVRHQEGLICERSRTNERTGPTSALVWDLEGFSCFQFLGGQHWMKTDQLINIAMQRVEGKKETETVLQQLPNSSLRLWCCYQGNMHVTVVFTTPSNIKNTYKQTNTVSLTLIIQNFHLSKV